MVWNAPASVALSLFAALMIFAGTRKTHRSVPSSDGWEQRSMLH